MGLASDKIPTINNLHSWLNWTMRTPFLFTNLRDVSKWYWLRLSLAQIFGDVCKNNLSPECKTWVLVGTWKNNPCPGWLQYCNANCLNSESKSGMWPVTFFECALQNEYLVFNVLLLNSSTALKSNLFDRVQQWIVNNEYFYRRQISK